MMLPVNVALLLHLTPIIAIQDVSVIDPGSNKLRTHVTVVVEGDTISQVAPVAKARIPEGATTIDGKGKYLMPGLYDMHVHLMDTKSLALFTANGVTGVRVMFGSRGHLTWRKQIEDKKLVGPRMFIGGPIVDGPKPVWPTSIKVSNEQEARQAVRNIKKDGYDFVKVYSLLSRESYFAIADECKKESVPFAGHVPESVSITEALGAGQASSEHLMGFAMENSSRGRDLRKRVEAACPDGLSKMMEVSKEIGPELKRSYDPQLADELVTRLSKGSLWQCPTLIVQSNISQLDQPAIKNGPYNKYMPAYLIQSWDPKRDFRFSSRTEEDWEHSRTSFKELTQLTSRLIKAKVPIIAGTDCLNPFVFAGFSLHDELGLLVKAGMKPTDAIKASTTSAAKFLGWERRAGKIAAGMDADLVLLDKNPLENISHTKTIRAVCQAGDYHDRADLDSILNGCEY